MKRDNIITAHSLVSLTHSHSRASCDAGGRAELEHADRRLEAQRGGQHAPRHALHIAAAAGNVDAVEYLVKTAPAADLEHIIEAKDRWGFTPLHEAENFDRSVIDKNGQAQWRSRVSIDDDAAERHGALSLPPHAPLASPLCTPSLGAPQP